MRWIQVAGRGAARLALAYLKSRVDTRRPRRLHLAGPSSFPTTVSGHGSGTPSGDALRTGGPRYQKPTRDRAMGRYGKRARKVAIEPVEHGRPGANMVTDVRTFWETLQSAVVSAWIAPRAWEATVPRYRSRTLSVRRRNAGALRAISAPTAATSQGLIP